VKDLSFDLARQPAHLGLGARASVEPAMTGAMEWYAAYAERHAADGKEGRLVSIHSFTGPWDSWEMHPNGDELVECLSGEMTLHQEVDGERQSVTLRPHEAVINPKGVWHTAESKEEATALFITAGAGTEHRSG